MNPLILEATKSRYDRIMSGEKPKPDNKQAWCMGKSCARFLAMGGSCSKENCQKI
jgi:hypothetical protein